MPKVRANEIYVNASKGDSEDSTLMSEPVGVGYIRPETALPGQYPEIDTSTPLPKQLQPGGRFLAEEEELLRQP